MATATPIELLECGHPESPHSEITRGYGIDADGNRHCYDCCKAHELASMIETGKATLYFCEDTREVTDWPGTLRFPLYPSIRKSHHASFSGRSSRYDFWFAGPDGYLWHGVQRGEWNQIARCRRTKELVK